MARHFIYLERQAGLYWFGVELSYEAAHIRGNMALVDSPTPPLAYHVFAPGNRTPFDHKGQVRHFIPRP